MKRMQLFLIIGLLCTCVSLQGRELSLQEAVETALAHNPEVAASQQDVAVLCTKLEQVRAHSRAQTDFTAGVIEFEHQPFMNVPPFTLPLPAQLGGPKIVQSPDLPLANSTITFGVLNLIYPLYTGGRVKYNLEEVHAGICALQAHAQATRNDVALSVVKAYLGTVLAQRVTAVNEEAYNTVKEHERQAEVLFRQGMVPKYEWMRAQTEVANQDRRRLDAQNQADLALAYLQDLLGTSNSEELTLNTPLRGDEEIAVELEAAKSTALAASDDMKALHYRDCLYAAGEKAALAEKHPQLEAVASKLLFLNTQPFTNPGGFLGLVAKFPLTDGGLASAEAAEQRALRVRNQDDAHRLRDGIQLEVRKYYLDLMSARKALDAADQAVELAQESLRLATRRFEEGQGTGVEKTDAILAQSLAETNREQARYQYDIAYYGLQKALGHLLDEF